MASKPIDLSMVNKVMKLKSSSDIREVSERRQVGDMKEMLNDTASKDVWWKKCRNGGRFVEELYFRGEHPSHTTRMVTSVFIPVDIKRFFGQVHTELCYVRSLLLRFSLEARFWLYLVK